MPARVMAPTGVKVAVQGRVRVLLGIVAAALIYAMWPAAGPKSPPSDLGRDARKPRATTAVSGSLEGRLDDLKQPPGSAETTRNPFRFSPKPQPPKPEGNTPPPSPAPRPGDPDSQPPPPPISIKFFGVAQQGTTGVAIFSDGNGLPVWASEGQTVLGQYKLLKISVESVTMSYLDGSGMQTIPLRG